MHAQIGVDRRHASLVYEQNSAEWKKNENSYKIRNAAAAPLSAKRGTKQKFTSIIQLSQFLLIR